MLALAAALFLQIRPTTVYIRATELMQQCRNITAVEPSGKGDFDQLSRCTGYLTGIVDGATEASGPKANPFFPVCIPTEVTIEQLVRVVLKYGDEHPEQLHKPAGTLVFNALAIAFPCQR